MDELEFQPQEGIDFPHLSRQGQRSNQLPVQQAWSFFPEGKEAEAWD